MQSHPPLRKPNPDLQRLEQLWPCLTPFQRKRLLLFAIRCALPPPVRFSLHAGLIFFALLPVFPLHPLSLPAAFGASLAFTLIGELYG